VVLLVLIFKPEKNEEKITKFLQMLVNIATIYALWGLL
jgi:hypothetical protein